MPYAQERRVIVIGQAGAGKTNLMALFAETPPAGHTAWLVDPYRDHDPPRHPDAQFVRGPEGVTPRAGAPLWDWYDNVARAALEIGNVWFIGDEIDSACRDAGPNGAPPHLIALAHHGRRRGISWVFAFRRPAEVPRHLTSQANESCVFRLEEEPEIKWVTSKGWLRGTNVDVMELQPGEYIHRATGLQPQLFKAPLLNEAA